MPVINRIAAFSQDMKTWRRWLHQNPELGLDCFVTAEFVASRLKEFGVDEIHEGIAKTGIVAIINGQGAGPTIGLRADMDALPMQETTGLEYASLVDGKMHACGHDGHTTMLLGAARYLAETRRFRGRVALVFQPAEEGGAGAEIMVEEGILDRFDISQIYGVHNAPKYAAGQFVAVPGPFMAAVDTFRINISGEGGHGAQPHLTKDPIVAAVAIVQALQTIVSRNSLALDDLVISVTQIHAGTVDNIIPQDAFVGGTVRTYDTGVQQMVIARMQSIVDGHCAAFGVSGELDFEIGYPATINNPEKTEFAARIAAEIVGENAVGLGNGPEMVAEDFSYMLQRCPGAYLYIGQGDSAPWHHPAYDFNDDISPIGASFFARLVEASAPL